MHYTTTVYTEEWFLNNCVAQLHVNPEEKSLMDSNSRYFSLPLTLILLVQNCNTPLWTTSSISSMGSPKEGNLEGTLSIGYRLRQRLTEGSTREATPTEYSLANKAAAKLVTGL